MTRKGRLSLVGLPIGHPDDIGQRAVDVLRDAEIILCSNLKEARRQLDRFEIPGRFVEIDAANLKAESEEFLMSVVQGKHVALITENGLPVLADFGGEFVRTAVDARVDVTIVPGPNAAAAAVALSGFNASRFLFYGYLSPNRQERRSELRRLRYFDSTMVFYDAAHRLPALLTDLDAVIGGHRQGCVVCDLSLPAESIRRGTLSQLLRHFGEHNKKRLFVVVVEGAADPGDDKRGRKTRS